MATTAGTDTDGSPCIDDVDEPNDSPDNAIALVPGSSLDDLDVARNPSLCPRDVNFYEFTLDAANYLIAEARFDRSMGNLRLSVVESGGMVLWSSEGGRLAAVHRLVESGGTFLLRVEHVNGTAKLDYNLRVRALPAIQ